MPTATDVLLGALARDPAAPRVTWYSAAGARVELSGASLANAVAKAAGLLQDELDVGPGVVVSVRLPLHWQAAVWPFAVWGAGGAVRLGPGRAAVELATVGDDTVASPGTLRAVVPTSPFGGPVGAQAAAGAVDLGALVGAMPDRFVPWAVPDAKDLAVLAVDADLTHGALVAAAPGSPVAAHDGAAAGPRLVRAPWTTGSALLADLVTPLLAGRALLLHAGDDEAVARDAVAERAEVPGDPPGYDR